MALLRTTLLVFFSAFLIAGCSAHEPPPANTHISVPNSVTYVNDTKQISVYTYETQPKNTQPQIIAEEPMIEVVSERIVGRNRPR